MLTEYQQWQRELYPEAPWWRRLICSVFHRADHDTLTDQGACRRCERRWRIW